MLTKSKPLNMSPSFSYTINIYGVEFTMKRIAILIMVIALFAMSATALSVTGPTLGNDKHDRIKNVATTFTIKNTDNSTTLTGITYSAGGGAENSKYALSFTGPTSLGPGQTGPVTVNGTIPLDHPGVDSDLEESAVKIGTITATGTLGSTTDSGSSDIMMQAINQLRIKKARIECETKSQSLDDGDRVKNLKPGNDCTLEIEVENEFDDNDNGNQKIGDISFDTIDFSIDSSDSDVDVDEDDDLDNLDAGDEDSVTFDLEIDEEADDGTITIDLRVSGRDDNGALHGESMDVRLEIERLSHDIQLRRVEVSPLQISNCEATSAHLSVNILNQGKRDEDEVAIEATVADLKFVKKIENIELDKDDSTSASFDVPVAKDTKPGVYRVDVKTYFDTTAPSNSGSVELKVEKCGQEVADEELVVSDQPKTDTTVTVPQTPPTTSGQVQAAPKKQSSFAQSKAYVGMLAVLIVLIAIGIVAMLVMLWKKKPVV